MRPLPCSLVAALTVLSLATPGLAADFAVTRYDDPVPDGCDNIGPAGSWDCSLREAVIASRVLVGPDRILLSAGRYELTRAGAGEDAAWTGDLDLVDSVEILGPGATMTTIDANDLDRVFEIRDSGAPGLDVVAISGVALTGGAAPGASGGAAIHVIGARLELERTEIHDNGPSGGTGTVLASFSAQLQVRTSAIRDNAGSGIFVVDSIGVAANVTISNNDGLELWVGAGGSALCNHCTIRDDEASQEVQLSGPTSLLQLANSTVIGTCIKSSGAIAVDSLGGNLESPGATCDFGGGDLESVVVHHFGLLGNHGGPTSTHVPGAGSPALDLAAPGLCASADQRGSARLPESCDSGAVERGNRPPTPIFHDGFGQGHTGAWSAAVAAVGFDPESSAADVSEPATAGR